MARNPNDIGTVQLTVSTTPPVKGYLEQLVSTGLYGKNSAEAAERLVARALEDLINRGALKREFKR